jgi:hypothetical protein
MGQDRLVGDGQKGLWTGLGKWCKAAAKATGHDDGDKIARAGPDPKHMKRQHLAILDMRQILDAPALHGCPNLTLWEGMVDDCGATVHGTANRIIQTPALRDKPPQVTVGHHADELTIRGRDDRHKSQTGLAHDFHGATQIMIIANADMAQFGPAKADQSHGKKSLVINAGVLTVKIYPNHN